MTGGRYPTQARKYTPSKYAPRGPVTVAAPAPLDGPARIALFLNDNTRIGGIASYRGSIFQNATELKDWLWAYRSNQARQFGQDTVAIDGTEIYLSAITEVK